jgi:hypothetical protein
MCRPRIILAALVILFTPPSLHAQQTTPPAVGGKIDEQRIATLVKQLGDAEFSVREAAQKQLLQIGEPAETAVAEAARSFDVEVSRRAKRILGELAKHKLTRLVDKVTWPMLLERVRQHAGAEEWKQPGFSDELIEGAIERLVDRVNEAAKEQRVKLPVRFCECQASRGRDGELRGEGLLICGTGSLEVSRGHRSIILVDGSVRIAYATECLIVARGAVSISHGQGNIILAEQFVDVAHEGTRLRIGGAPIEGGSSLILSGNILRISHAQRAVCGAPSIDISHGTDCVFLHGGGIPAPMPRGGVAVEAKLPFAPAAKKNPLQGKLKVTQVVDSDNRAENLAIIEQGGVEIVIRPGQEIKDNLGQPIPALAGWKLAFIGDHYALFSNGKEDAGFVIPGRE